MRTLMLLFSGMMLAGCAASPPPPPATADVETALASSRAAAGDLGGQLIAALTAAMADTGPAGAIAVCNEKAPEIASRISASRNLEIGRTSTRVRNPANAADDWETAQLAAFAEAIAGGANPATLERHEVLRDGDGWQVRWMKPIVLQPMCATCHGEAVDPALLAAIQARYPGDAATGFKPGELRGAFTASVKLPGN